MKRGCFAKRSTKIICEGLTSLKYSWKVTKKEETSKLTVRSRPALSKSGLRAVLLSLTFYGEGPWGLEQPPQDYTPSKTESNSLSSPPAPHYQFIFTIHSSCTKSISPLKTASKKLKNSEAEDTQNSKHKIEEPMVILLKTRAKTHKHTFINDKWHPCQKDFAWM